MLTQFSDHRSSAVLKRTTVKRTSSKPMYFIHLFVQSSVVQATLQANCQDTHNNIQYSLHIRYWRCSGDVVRSIEINMLRLQPCTTYLSFIIFQNILYTFYNIIIESVVGLSPNTNTSIDLLVSTDLSRRLTNYKLFDLTVFCLLLLRGRTTT